MTSELTARVLRTIDTKQPGPIGDLFAPDGRLAFGNNDPAVGRPAIVAALSGFASTVQGLEHRLLHEWSLGADTIVETEVTYERLDGKRVTVPAASLWRVGDDGLIEDFRVYLDLAPVYAP
jgi:SnoaL-like protein